MLTLMTYTYMTYIIRSKQVKQMIFCHANGIMLTVISMFYYMKKIMKWRMNAKYNIETDCKKNLVSCIFCWQFTYVSYHIALYHILLDYQVMKKIFVFRGINLKMLVPQKFYCHWLLVVSRYKTQGGNHIFMQGNLISTNSKSNSCLP